MDKKEIQDQRMRRYFIEATKEIIKGESISALTVRNVAERAGYSYATLYNYFKDLRKLTFEALREFIDECIVFIQNEFKDSTPGENRIRYNAIGYIKFFVQYPSIYQLAFIDKPNSVCTKSAEIELISNIPGRLIEEDWKIWKVNNGVSNEIAEATLENYRLVLNGLLLFYMNRRFPESYSDMMNSLHNQLDFILNVEKKWK